MDTYHRRQEQDPEVSVMAWRLFEVEPALLAFVQHFDFIWDSGRIYGFFSAGSPLRKAPLTFGTE
jgi:hypothetical protein